jgi:hypothetical protein
MQVWEAAAASQAELPPADIAPEVAEEPSRKRGAADIAVAIAEGAAAGSAGDAQEADVLPPLKKNKTTAAAAAETIAPEDAAQVAVDGQQQQEAKAAIAAGAIAPEGAEQAVMVGQQQQQHIEANAAIKAEPLQQRHQKQRLHRSLPWPASSSSRSTRRTMHPAMTLSCQQCQRRSSQQQTAQE